MTRPKCPSGKWTTQSGSYFQRDTPELEITRKGVYLVGLQIYAPVLSM